MVALQTFMTRLGWSIALLFCLTLGWGLVQQPTLAVTKKRL